MTIIKLNMLITEEDALDLSSPAAALCVASSNALREYYDGKLSNSNDQSTLKTLLCQYLQLLNNWAGLEEKSNADLLNAKITAVMSAFMFLRVSPDTGVPVASSGSHHRVRRAANSLTNFSAFQYAPPVAVLRELAQRRSSMLEVGASDPNAPTPPPRTTSLTKN